jgi:hypothetical protein
MSKNRVIKSPKHQLIWGIRVSLTFGARGLKGGIRSLFGRAKMLESLVFVLKVTVAVLELIVAISGE